MSKSDPPTLEQLQAEVVRLGNQVWSQDALLVIIQDRLGGLTKTEMAKWKDRDRYGE